MQTYIKTLFYLLFIFANTEIFAQQVVINELMATNGVTVYDEDGDYSDWFELYNREQTAVDLNGFGLSDDPSSPFKWIMPQITIEPQNYLLIYASDKNRKKIVKHWETVIDWGDLWKYKLGTSEPPADWRSITFDDSTWEIGPSGFGYGDDDDATIVPHVPSIFVRKVFNIADTSVISAAVFHIDYDDGFVAYLNGVEIARANMGGVVNVPPAYDELALTYVEAQMFSGGKPKSFNIVNYQSLLRNGENVLSVQVHNAEDTSDMTLIPFLTLGMNEPPPNPQGANPILDLPYKYLHTNFKLSASGEQIIVTNPQGTRIDQIVFGNQSGDISYGRCPDGDSIWSFFPNPTPGSSNPGFGYSGTTNEPEISPQAGFYDNPVTVTVTPFSSNDTIYYTLDGSEPDRNSILYTAPILIQETKILRVRAFSPGLLPSRTKTNSYFLNFSHTLPVVSLSTDPYNLFDEEYGIYAMGDSANPDWPHYGANFWQDWERPIHIELFESDGTLGFSVDGGVKIFGGVNRAFPQKSLAIFMRGHYGYSDLDYKLFDNLPFRDYEAFVLRNSGNDWISTMFRDGLMTSLVDNIGIDKQAYRPSIVFINGVYWGILNIREKINEHFLVQHHSVNIDSLDLIEGLGEIMHGSVMDYFAFFSFVENNSMNVPENFEYVKSKIDVENFIKYFVSEIYFANTDWPVGNIRYWKEGKNGKWRWILYDTDHGFGLVPSYLHNTLEFATATNGPSWPNPPRSTLLLRKFLENENFKNAFINCFADFSNSIFKAQVVNDRITLIKSLIQSEIQRHGAKWNQFDLTQWLNNVQVLRDFADNRIFHVRQHFMDKFGLSGLASVNISISDTSMGSVKLNFITIKDSSWNGQYFLDVPINLIAMAKQGFRFVRWEGSSTSSNDSLTVTPNGSINLTAVFDVDTTSAAPNIVINEINYNSSSSFNTEDWIELYNNTGAPVDISGWKFKDSDDSHIFTIPQGTVLGVDGYLVLCVDTSLFKPLFPNVHNFIGNLGFGLSGSGELIRLYDNNLVMMDSLIYDDAPPWPTQPDGNGPTLALKNPTFDNTLGENWAASLSHGTPGEMNDVFVPIELIALTAEVDAKKIIIKWTTASETNNHGFFIERSFRGVWETVGFVEGRGTSTEISSYEFTDNFSVKERKSVVKYRLKQVDFDNSYTFSEIVEVELNPIPDKFELLQNYPNPFNSTTKIEFAVIEKGNVTLTIHNILGEKVKVLLNEERDPGLYSVELNASELASGVYFYKLHTGKFTDIKKMIYLR